MAAQTQRAIDRWKAALADWGIPPDLLAAAPESPWQFDRRTFAARADSALRESAPTPSRMRALEALPEGGAVLDVGCGAGAASLPLMRRASRLIAVDPGRRCSTSSSHGCLAASISLSCTDQGRTSPSVWSRWTSSCATTSPTTFRISTSACSG